jgi:HSP20 family protein
MLYFTNFFENSRTDWRPNVNVDKDDNAYVISMDMPGLSRGDIDVEIEGRRLVVKATRNVNQCGNTRKLSMYESWDLTDSCNVEQLTANYDAGVLTIRVPTSDKVRRKIQVD